jgi:endonuclease YncB( thermonuclease family)
MRLRILLTVLVVCFLIACFLFVASGKAEDLANVQWLDCHDGDTCAFNVLLPAVFGSNLGVRLSGIDAPELLGKCDKEKQLAAQARDFLIAQLKTGPVHLIDVFRDKYFRVEATLLVNGVNLNHLMVQQGYAIPYAGQGPKHDWCATP